MCKSDVAELYLMRGDDEGKGVCVLGGLLRSCSSNMGKRPRQKWAWRYALVLRVSAFSKPCTSTVSCLILSPIRGTNTCKGM